MLSPGDRFGDYTVVRLLGKGGMGSVFLLRAADGSPVAAKILDAASDDHESRKRFLREAQLALGVKHPNLVEVYDVGEDPDSGLCYILMEYVPNGSLADYLKTNGALPIEDAVAVVEAMAQVLEIARQKGIVHRDIKPGNIMFDAEGTPKLADLGIARGGIAGTETTTVTQTGMMIGTPAYMAPEQMLDAHGVDTRADIYSLGVVFFEMLTGERPNKDDTVVQLMAKAVKGEPLPDVRTLRPEVSASLAQLLAMMVAPDKDGRISTPGQITSALAIIERGGEFVGEAVGEGAARRTAVATASRLAVARRICTHVGEASSPRQRDRDIKAFPWKSLVLLAVLGTLAAAFAVLALRKNSPQSPVFRPEPTPIVRSVVQTNVVEKVIERTVPQSAERAGYRSPYRLKRLSELEPNSQTRLKDMAVRRRSGERRGVMVFGTLRVDGQYSGKDVASWAWLGQNGWFSADVWPADGGAARDRKGRRLVFLKHGYEPLEVDLSHEADREWSDAEAYDIGSLEMKLLDEDRQCAISATVRLPAGVPEAELRLSLDNRSPCGYDWGTYGRLQRPKREVLRRNVRSDETVRIDGCTPTDYEVDIRAPGCVRFLKRIDASDATSRNLKTISLMRGKRATFALRPFVGGPWQVKSVFADGEQALRFEDGQSRHVLRLDPYEQPRGLSVSSFYQPSTYDDYGELTTNMIDRQALTGALAAPVSLNPRRGNVCFHPGRIYRFRNSHQPVDVLIAFLDYREEQLKSLPTSDGRRDDAPVGNSAPPGWLDDLDVAKEQAKRENKQILAAFEGSDWCGWCKKMEQDVYTKPEFLPTVSSRFVPVYIDKPRDRTLLRETVREKNPALHGEYDIRGVPCVVILDAEGKELGRVGGYKKGVAELIERIDALPNLPREKIMTANGLVSPEALRDSDATRQAQKALDALFSGWKVSQVIQDPNEEVRSGFHQRHRGRANVVLIHPLNRETPAVLSRRVEVPKKNPCLVLEVASRAEDTDFQLAVRVNGKDVMPLRLVCTPDALPWERIVVPLARWKGKKVNIEVVFVANNWFYEHAYLARLEVVEGKGGEKTGPVGVRSESVFPCASVNSAKWKSRQPWRYSLREPPANWRDVGFDDSGWRRTVKPLGYGVVPTAVSIAENAEWTSGRVWMRRTFQHRQTGPVYKVQFDVYFDQDAEVWLNGTLVLPLGGWNCWWTPLAARASLVSDLLRDGENVLAVTVKGDGSSYFDCGLTIETLDGKDTAPRTEGGFLQEPASSKEKFADKDSTRRVQKTLDSLFPGWKTSANAPKAVHANEEIGYVSEICGRMDVLATLPRSSHDPVRLTRTMVLPENARLSFGVRKNPTAGGGFVIQVYADGKRRCERLVNEGRWLDQSVDLSDLSGKETRLEIRHLSHPDYGNARALWSKIEVK